jgi:DNA repair exonuclease SbcCD ATPase subunit
MKATLTLDDIGGFKGRRVFEFDSGTVNIVEAPNSGGKSSVVRALLGVLSVPNDGNFDPYLLKEARNLGIKTDELNTPEGFVNIHSEEGQVDLELDGKLERYRLKQNGTYIDLPQTSDPRFLLSGILSNDSKILRQLRHSDEETEPDDFYWAVSRLSKAKQYDEIVDSLKNEKENLARKNSEAQRLIERTTDLRNEIDKLEREGEKIDSDIRNLESRFSGKKTFGELQKAHLQLRTISQEILDTEENIQKNAQDFAKLQTDLEKLKGQKRRCEEELEELELGGLQVKDLSPRDFEQKKSDVKADIDAKVNQLKLRRAEIDGVYNLLYLAQGSFKDSVSTRCPLCDSDKLNQKVLENKLESYKRQKEAINREIYGLNIDRDNIIRNIDAVKERSRSIVTEIEDFDSDISSKVRAIEEVERERHALITPLHEKKEKKTRIEENLAGLQQLADLDPDTLLKQYNEKERQKTKISDSVVIRKHQIEDSNVELDGKKIEPTHALNIISKFDNFLEKLITYSKERADRQRQAAADNFNGAIDVLINDLDFPEFRSVKLNREFRLYVERFDSRTEDYVTQNVSTLSTSEKLTIALILQIALKETYLPNKRFLLIDDVVEDFDEERRGKILQYLSDKAQEQDWIVIVTKLIEEKTPIRITHLGSNKSRS